MNELSGDIRETMQTVRDEFAALQAECYVYRILLFNAGLTACFFHHEHLGEPLPRRSDLMMEVSGYFQAIQRNTLQSGLLENVDPKVIERVEAALAEMVAPAQPRA